MPRHERLLRADRTDEHGPPYAVRHPSRCVSVRLKLSDSAFTHERDRRRRRRRVHRVRPQLLRETRRNARERDVIDRNCLPFLQLNIPS